MKTLLFYFTLLGIAISLSACFLTWAASGVCLYYRVVGMKTELLKIESITGDTVVVDSSSIFSEGETFYLRVKFILKADGSKERGRYPSDVYTKCSVEKINTIRIKIMENSHEVYIEKNLIGLRPDSIYNYKRNFYTHDLPRIDAMDINDFIKKFNDCDVEVQQSYLAQYGVVFQGHMPTMKAGHYYFTSEILFNNYNILKDSLNIKYIK